jgi:hypothetical protein
MTGDSLRRAFGVSLAERSSRMYFIEGSRVEDRYRIAGVRIGRAEAGNLLNLESLNPEIEINLRNSC